MTHAPTPRKQSPAGPGATKPLLTQGALYALVGLVQLGADWVLFVVLSYWGLQPVLANILGRLAGAGLGFFLNGRITFRDANRPSRLHVRSLAKFAISWAAMTTLSTLLVMASVAAFGLEATWLTKPMIDVLLAAAGFLASKYWIYR